jgi:DNA-binding response OmpR family regulator
MSRSKNILIIEDDESWYEAVRTRLKHSDFDCEIHVETTCVDGFDYFKNNTQDVDLILLDINAPEEGCGVEVLRKIRSMPSDIWVGVMTFSSDEYNISCAKLDCVFMSKNSTGLMEEGGLIELLKTAPYPSLKGTQELCNMRLVDNDNKFISINEIQLDLTKQQADILYMLYTKPDINGIERPSGIYTEKEIQQHINPGTVVEPGNISNAIRKLRKKISKISEDCPHKIIKTHIGFNSYSCPFSPPS